MKSHWNEDEFAEHAIAPRAQSHASGCEECRGEAEEFRRELRGFRDVVRSAAERPALFWAAQRTSIRSRVASGIRIHTLQFALASTAALIAVGTALLLPAPTPRNFVAGNRPAQVDQDELLMRQVDDALLSNVPDSLEPANLIASDMGTALSKAQQNSQK